jgi:nicotinate-nucleotide adenylyltransferase
MSSSPISTGLYFGTFNPIHTGHLMVAQAVLHQFGSTLGLTHIRFIPAGDPPHRFHEEDLLDARRRFKMVQLAIAANPAFVVSDMELQRAQRNDSRSYTIDTLRQLIQDEGWTTPIPLIIGADALAGLASWREPEALIETVHFLQAPRPGYEWVERITIEGRAIPISTSRIEMPALSLASSWIRSQIRKQATTRAALRYFLPDTVRQFIEANRLYQR